MGHRYERQHRVEEWVEDSCPRTFKDGYSTKESLYSTSSSSSCLRPRHRALRDDVYSYDATSSDSSSNHSSCTTSSSSSDDHTEHHHHYHHYIPTENPPSPRSHPLYHRGAPSATSSDYHSFRRSYYNRRSDPSDVASVNSDNSWKYHLPLEELANSVHSLHSRHSRRDGVNRDRVERALEEYGQLEEVNKHIEARSLRLAAVRASNTQDMAVSLPEDVTEGDTLQPLVTAHGDRYWSAKPLQYTWFASTTRVPKPGEGGVPDTATVEYTPISDKLELTVGSTLVGKILKLMVFIPVNEARPLEAVTLPVKEAFPRISNIQVVGEHEEGHTLTIARYDYVGPPDKNVIITWFREGETVTNADNSKSYLLLAEDVGKIIRVEVLPQRTDGVIGTPATWDSDHIRVGLPTIPGIEIVGAALVGEELSVKLTGRYTGGKPGNSKLLWKRVDKQAHEEIIWHKGTKRTCVNEDIDSYIKVECTPVRMDGVEGATVSDTTKTVVQRLKPRIHSLQIQGPDGCAFLEPGNVVTATWAFSGGQQGDSSIQWYRVDKFGSAHFIAADTRTITLTASEVGTKLKVIVVPTSFDGVVSAPVATTTTLEVRASRPSITMAYIEGPQGAYEGELVTVSYKVDWNDAMKSTVMPIWHRDGNEIAWGVERYILQPEDATRDITCSLVAINSKGQQSDKVFTPPFKPMEAPPRIVNQPTIEGSQVGKIARLAYQFAPEGQEGDSIVSWECRLAEELGGNAGTWKFLGRQTRNPDADEEEEDDNRFNSLMVTANMVGQDIKVGILPKNCKGKEGNIAFFVSEVSIHAYTQYQIKQMVDVAECKFHLEDQTAGAFRVVLTPKKLQLSRVYTAAHKPKSKPTKHDTMDTNTTPTMFDWTADMALEISPHDKREVTLQVSPNWRKQLFVNNENNRDFVVLCFRTFQALSLERTGVELVGKEMYDAWKNRDTAQVKLRQLKKARHVTVAEKSVLTHYGDAEDTAFIAKMIKMHYPLLQQLGHGSLIENTRCNVLKRTLIGLFKKYPYDKTVLLSPTNLTRSRSRISQPTHRSNSHGYPSGRNSAESTTLGVARAHAAVATISIVDEVKSEPSEPKPQAAKKSRLSLGSPTHKDKDDKAAGGGLRAVLHSNRQKHHNQQQ